MTDKPKLTNPSLYMEAELREKINQRRESLTRFPTREQFLLAHDPIVEGLLMIIDSLKAQLERTQRELDLDQYFERENPFDPYSLKLWHDREKARLEREWNRTLAEMKHHMVQAAFTVPGAVWDADAPKEDSQ